MEGFEVSGVELVAFARWRSCTDCLSLARSASSVSFIFLLMKDRIQAIMETKGMAQNVFAQTLGLSPATISSIFTGRTNPTNNHVQAIHRAFPEINTNWLLFGEGEMYVEEYFPREQISHEEIGQNVGSGEGINNSDGQGIEGGEEALSLFPEMEHTVARHKGRSAELAGQVSAAALVEFQTSVLAQLEQMKNIDKNERKIKEIRVFYSDGTFEAFAPLVK